MTTGAHHLGWERGEEGGLTGWGIGGESTELVADRGRLVQAPVCYRMSDECGIPPAGAERQKSKDHRSS